MKAGTAARIVICGLSFLAVAWGVYVFPLLWRPMGIENTGKHIIAGDTFKDSALSILAKAVDENWNHADPSALKSVAYIRLRLVERAMAQGDTEALDGDLSRLDSSIRVALTKTPAEPFLWIMLYWVENVRDGFSRDHLKYLRMSYSLGPNEGWIAVKRNRFALAIFNQLPPNLKSEAVAEFAGLVRSNFVKEAADILVGPGWPIRKRLLSALVDVPLIKREWFERVVDNKGYDISVPGVTPPPPRPWR